MTARGEPAVLTPEQARRLLLSATHLVDAPLGAGLEGARAALVALGCVQLDPIDRIGTNADLVLHARVDGLRRGDWARTMPGHAFEHFAKERCLLPSWMFPVYRDQVAETPWWRLSERLDRIPIGVLDAVLAEIRAHGPMPVSALADHGRVEPMDWSGWKGTGKAASLAVEVLWTRCQVVTAGRTPSGQRIYDVPERALPEVAAAPGADFGRTCLMARVRSAGLLAEATGPWWSMLREVRDSGLPDRLVAEGALVRIQVAGSRRTFLALPEHLAADLDREPDHGEDLRILGPLDPLMWNRTLVRQVFDFDYVWEVYKPAGQRRWGYYVCPLLHRGRLVGRVEARRGDSGIEVQQLWGAPERGPLARAVERLAAMQEPRC